VELYIQIFFTTLAISFGILHLILFIYNRQLKGNLYFAVFLFLYSLNIFFDYQATLSTNSVNELFYLRIHRAVFPYPTIFAIITVYQIFNFKIPKYFWIISFGLIITAFPSIIEPVQYFNYAHLFMLPIVIEAIRVFNAANREKKEGALIVTLAFLFLVAFSLYDLILDLNLIGPILNIHNGYPFGFGILLLLMSIYLAHDFARVNKKIISQEREAKENEISQKLLEAEDKRKSKELNDARELQLSLLPKCDSHIGEFEICFDMRTASEVGGDYYDYSLSDDGELSIVIGDATDHGMKAGMMVSIVKSMFLARDNNADIVDFLNKCSHTIKEMKLKNLYMALMYLKIKDRKLTASSAGIPPFLIFRNKTNSVEEFKIKGMPLGAVNSFPYQIVETELEIGDTVLLMTDGLPELFNKDKELFGDERLKEVFHKNATLPANKIVKELFLAGKEWGEDSDQNDDITFVVFRLTQNL